MFLLPLSIDHHLMQHALHTRFLRISSYDYMRIHVAKSHAAASYTLSMHLPLQVTFYSKANFVTLTDNDHRD